MDLSHHIEELLYANDCVIIPSIGGFIANYAPASIDLIDQQLYPPKKTVSFNPKLVNNDGLFINYIVQKELLSYKQAAQKLEEFSRQIENDLFNNRIVHFHNIGKLYFNSDSKLEFVPNNTNFLLETYGLPNISCAPILRNKDYLIKEKEQKDKESKTKLTTKKDRKNPILLTIAAKRKMVAVAAAILLVFSTPYIYGLLFSDVSNTTSSSQTIAKEDNNSNNKNKTSTASILPTLSSEKNDVEVEVIPTKEEEKSIVEKKTILQDDDAQTYIIVLGAFGKKDNAERMVKRLAKDNYLPDLSPKNGLSRVGVQLTCNPAELETHLKFLQDNYNPKAWVVE